MRKEIAKLEDILALELQGLYNGEGLLKERIQVLLPVSESKELKEILSKYAESSDHKKLKIERMFSYLLVEPPEAHNKVMKNLLDETEFRAEHALKGKFKNLVLINGLHIINQYKLAIYRTALTYSLELELDTVSDLLHQVIEWECKTGKALAGLSYKEFSNSPICPK